MRNLSVDSACDDRVAHRRSRVDRIERIAGDQYKCRRSLIGRKTKLTMIGGMMKRQMMSVQCLPREVDGSNGFGSVNISLLSYERMTAQASLDANLVAFSRVQTDLDE